MEHLISIASNVQSAIPDNCILKVYHKGLKSTHKASFFCEYGSRSFACIFELEKWIPFWSTAFL